MDVLVVGWVGVVSEEVGGLGVWVREGFGERSW